MRILVTGAAGKLGLKLIESLLSKGLEVVALIHNSKIEKPIEQIQADLLDQAGLIEAFRGIDLVIHLAALTHSYKDNNYFKVNLEGTKNVVLACQRNQIKRLIFVSTRAIGKEAGSYGYSKYLAEEAINSSGLDWTIIRPSEIYGLSGSEGIDELIDLSQKSFIVPFINSKNCYLNPVNYQDVVNFLVEVVINPKDNSKIYNLTGPKDYTYKELVVAISNIFSKKKYFFPVPIFLLKILASFNIFITPDQIPRLLVDKSSDISLAISDYNYQPADISVYLNKIKKQND